MVSRQALTTLPSLAAASLTLTAPAKVNLYLRVVNRRPDGFHNLETLMVAIDLCDTLEFSPAEPGRISLTIANELAPGAVAETGAPLAVGEDNLVLRAARLLASEAGVNFGAAIHLTKRIPWAAGLAGGSSDAATTLSGLNRLWRLDWPLERLRDLSARLGSDIPFFLGESRAAVCRGRGELLSPARIPAGLPLVLIKPRAGLSTPQVFKQCRPDDPGFGADELVQHLAAGRLDRAARCLHNGLQPAAEGLCADVVRCRTLCESVDVHGHLMSGSGTSYFALCQSWSQARRLAARWRNSGEQAAWAVRTCV